MNETWLPIPGFEGDYEASSTGRIRRLTYKSGTSRHVYSEPRIMSQYPLPRGYLRVTLSRNSKSKAYSVHRLVLLAFKGDSRGLEGAHLNGDCQDNRIENLEWVTAEENYAQRASHGTCAKGIGIWCTKLTDDLVREIRQLSVAGETKISLSRKFNVSPSTISGIVRRVTWKHVI